MRVRNRLVVADFKGPHEITSKKQLRALLKTRFENDANCFWMAKEEGGFPTLAIVIKGGLAHLDFIPADREAGWTCQGDLEDTLKGDTTVFYITERGEKLWISNASVVPFRHAVGAAEDFFSIQELPKSLNWLKL